MVVGGSFALVVGISFSVMFYLEISDGEVFHPFFEDMGGGGTFFQMQRSVNRLGWSRSGF